jgi:predicted negative regulator of RcsB-dependent stress response
MTQATQTKKLHRKDLKLKEPDEFISISRRVVTWAKANALAVQIGVGVVVLLVLTIGAARWYAQSRDASAARQFYGASELFKREQWDAAQESFAELANDYGSTAYGTLAKLYAGRSALNAQRPSDAVAPLTDFVSAAPSLALEQIGRLGLAKALESTGDSPAARSELERALELDGPLRPEVTMSLAQLEETGGNREKAIELYRKYLADQPDGATASLARMRLVGLGVTPPASPPGMTLPAGGLDMPPIQVP